MTSLRAVLTKLETRQSNYDGTVHFPLFACRFMAPLIINSSGWEDRHLLKDTLFLGRYTHTHTHTHTHNDVRYLLEIKIISFSINRMDQSWTIPSKKELTVWLPICKTASICHSAFWKVKIKRVDELERMSKVYKDWKESECKYYIYMHIIISTFICLFYLTFFRI